MESIALDTLCDELLSKAHGSSSGRSAQTIHGGHDQVLRQTVLALVAGNRLGAHDSPGEATLQVLRGQVTLVADDREWDLAAGDYVVIPPVRHSVHAHADSAILLSVGGSR